MADVPALRTYLRNVIGLGNDATGLDRANAVIDEGLTAIDDIADLNADKGVRAMTANVQKPGSQIQDPVWVDPGGGAIAPMMLCS